jgi:hypothetical protein
MNLVGTILAGGAVAGILVLLSWHYSRSRSVLEKWADENRLKIVDSEYRSFARGPFSWTTSRNQTVYYVTVIDDNGHTRRGWVRCGGFFVGFLCDRMEVTWTE